MVWDYLKVLPHTWNNIKTKRYFATDAEELTDIVVELDKEFDERYTANKEEEKTNDATDQKESSEPYRNHKPYYLIFIDK